MIFIDGPNGLVMSKITKLSIPDDFTTHNTGLEEPEDSNDPTGSQYLPYLIDGFDAGSLPSTLTEISVPDSWTFADVLAMWNISVSNGNSFNGVEVYTKSGNFLAYLTSSYVLRKDDGSNQAYTPENYSLIDEHMVDGTSVPSPYAWDSKQRMFIAVGWGSDDTDGYVLMQDVDTGHYTLTNK